MMSRPVGGQEARAVLPPPRPAPVSGEGTCNVVLHALAAVGPV